VSTYHTSWFKGNILIKKDRRACLADFGLTKINAEFTSSGLDNSEGTTFWTSPETLDPERVGCEKARPTMESDVYSLGMVIYEVCMIFAV
jgi:serine/threonine protein kinase